MADFYVMDKTRQQVRQLLQFKGDIKALTVDFSSLAIGIKHWMRVHYVNIEEIRNTLTEQELQTALELGILQLCRLKLDELEREIVDDSKHTTPWPRR